MAPKFKDFVKANQFWYQNMERAGIDSIVQKEIGFLRTVLQDFRIDGPYCFGYVNAENYEEVIEQFL